MQDLGPLGCVPAQRRLGRQELAAFLVGERVAKSEIHALEPSLGPSLDPSQA